jgi:predicted transcriptional regulator
MMSPKNPSKRSDRTRNDVAWAALFERHAIFEGIEQNGIYEISAAQINSIGREARLMTKFDHRVQLPILFRRYGLTIQPNSRGTYLIGRFASYQDLVDVHTTPVVEVAFPPDIQTIDPEQIKSEAAALLCASVSGIIADVLGEDARLTVMGRMGSGKFNYQINEGRDGARRNIEVVRAQIEIDGGFESASRFAIIEAKNADVDDFLIRQLYYPYRVWKPKSTKEIVPIFLSYTNDIFSFHIYRVRDEGDYNSLELVELKRYEIVTGDIELEDIRTLLDEATVAPEPADVPFPQADNFNRVIDLLTRLSATSAPLTQEDITEYNAFNRRQTQYYTNAAAYLGLVERQYEREQGVTYALTAKGKRIMRKKRQARRLAIVEAMLQHKVFNECVRLYLDQAEPPTKEQVVEIMRGAELVGLDREGTTTIPRRAGTVMGWIKWVMELTRI